MTLRYTYSSKDGFVPDNDRSSGSNNIKVISSVIHPMANQMNKSFDRTSQSGIIHHHTPIHATIDHVAVPSYEHKRPKSAGPSRRKLSSTGISNPTYPLWHKPSSMQANRDIELDWNSSSVVKLRQRVKSFQQMFSSTAPPSSLMRQSVDMSKKSSSMKIKSSHQRDNDHDGINEMLSSIVNWIRLREGFIVELITMTTTTKPKKKHNKYLKDRFLILFQALRKITFRIVDGYRSCIIANHDDHSKDTMLDDVRTYVASLVYCYDTLPRDPYHAWIHVDCSSNPLLCDKKVDGTSAIISHSHDDHQKHMIAAELKLAPEDESRCDELQHFIWSTFTKYQDEKTQLHMQLQSSELDRSSSTSSFWRRRSFTRPSSSNDTNRPSSSSSVRAIKLTRPSTAGATSSIRQRFDEIMRISSKDEIFASQFTEAETEAVSVTIDDDLSSDDEGVAGGNIITHHQQKRCFHTWFKEIFYWQRIRSYTRCKRKMIARKVFEELQRNVWANINYRRLQLNYILHLQRICLNAWKQHHIGCQHIDQLHASSLIRVQRYYYLQWKEYLQHHHQHRDFKRRMRCRRLQPLMHLWRLSTSIIRYQHKWHHHNHHNDTSSCIILFYQHHLLHHVFQRWKHRHSLYHIMRICMRYRQKVTLYEAMQHWRQYCECAQLMYDDIPLSASNIFNSNMTSPRSPIITAIHNHQVENRRKLSQNKISSSADITPTKLPQPSSSMILSSPAPDTINDISFTMQTSTPASPNRTASGHRGMLSLIQDSRKGIHIASNVWNTFRNVFTSNHKRELYAVDNDDVDEK